MIKQIYEHKKQFLTLLLLADEQESMIDTYLEQGDFFVLEEDGVKGICVVTDEGNGNFEIKNIAIDPLHQGKGYGKKLIHFVLEHYASKGHTMFVGTGDSLLTVPFYEACGFMISHKIKNFFIDNYNHPIYEADKQLIDMIVLKKIWRC